MPDTLPPNPIALTTLEELLGDEIRQYEATVQKLTLKKELIVTGNAHKLSALDQELLTLARKASQLERQRQALMTELGQPGAPLKALIATLAPAHHRRFTLLRDRLSRAVLDAQKLNGETRDLLSLSLQWLHETVEIIAGAINPEGASYTAHGAPQSQRNATTKATVMKSTISHSA